MRFFQIMWIILSFVGILLSVIYLLFYTIHKNNLITVICLIALTLCIIAHIYIPKEYKQFTSAFIVFLSVVTVFVILRQVK